MLSTLFQPEITDLESQIAQMQAQIAAAQQRIASLSETEFMTAGAIEAMHCAVKKISTLAPGAITNLKAAVLNLFNGDDDDDQPSAPTPNAPTGGIEAETEPQPNDAIKIISVTYEPSPEQCELASWLTCDVLSGQKSDLIDQWWHEMIHQKFTRCELACLLEEVPPEALKGQSVELACALEDAPESALKGQAYELTCDREDKSQRFVELVNVSDGVAYQRRFDGEIICAYAGFSNKAKARLWGEWLASKHTIASGFEVRESIRLSTKHELKLWGINLEQIQRLAECDLTKSPPSNFGDAPLRNHYTPAPSATPPAAEVEDLEPGSVVRSIACPEWMYRVIEVRDNGVLDCERLGVREPYRLGIKVNQVSLVSKKVFEEEAIASIQPPEQQQLAYNPYPVGRKGAAVNWKAVQASGGLNTTTNIDPMEKWRRIEAEQKAIALIRRRRLLERDRHKP